MTSMDARASLGTLRFASTLRQRKLFDNLTVCSLRLNKTQLCVFESARLDCVLSGVAYLAADSQSIAVG